MTQTINLEQHSNQNRADINPIRDTFIKKSQTYKLPLPWLGWEDL